MRISNTLCHHPEACLCKAGRLVNAYIGEVECLCLTDTDFNGKPCPFFKEDPRKKRDKEIQEIEDEIHGRRWRH